MLLCLHVCDVCERAFCAFLCLYPNNDCHTVIFESLFRTYCMQTFKLHYKLHQQLGGNICFTPLGLIILYILKFFRSLGFLSVVCVKNSAWLVRFLLISQCCGFRPGLLSLSSLVHQLWQQPYMASTSTSLFQLLYQLQVSKKY